jgi:tryptophan-rich sensory protein
MTNGNHGNSNRLLSLAMIGVFDIAGPLVAYSMLRSAGQSQVSALILSGAFPALGILVGVIRHRRVDTIGVLVLAGIAVGTVLGLLSGSARLVLAEGSVPTAVFGLLCLGSLWARRPLIYRFAIEFIGADTPRGRDFESLWQYPAFRHSFRLYTLVWGVVYLAEAVARVVIVETTSTSTALSVSKVMPYVVAGALIAWMTAHGRQARREGERIAAAETAAQAIAETAAQAVAEAPAETVAEASAETAANPPAPVAASSCAA